MKSTSGIWENTVSKFIAIRGLTDTRGNDLKHDNDTTVVILVKQSWSHNDITVYINDHM